MVLAVYGAGGLGREILELAKIINAEKGNWKEIIFIDDGEVPSIVDGCKVYKYDDAKETYGNHLEIAMGIGEPAIREKLFLKIRKDKISMPILIHPDVHIPNSVKMGEGVIIQQGCWVSVGVTLQNYVFLQPNCAVGHDCYLDEGCIISAFGSIGGADHIGRYTYVGMCVGVKELLSIGDYSIVGMGSTVFRDIPDAMIAMGNPARVLRRNEEKHVFRH